MVKDKSQVSQYGTLFINNNQMFFLNLHVNTHTHTNTKIVMQTRVGVECDNNMMGAKEHESCVSSIWN